MQIDVVGVLVNAIIIITGTNACDNSICFSWTIKTHQLKLVCKIRFLHYSVTILDPSGEEEAYCIPPVQYSKCDLVNHGVVEQNLKTNETIVTVWDISSKFNGNWTCLHGFGTGSASAEVFLTPVYGLMEENGHKCIWEFLSWTMIGLVPTFMIVRFVVWMLRSKACKGCSFRLKCNEIKKKRKRICFKVIAYISLLMFLFGMPIFIGLSQGRHCIAPEAFFVVGAIVAVTFNVLLHARNDDMNNGNNSSANRGENNDNANVEGIDDNANGGENNGNSNGGGNNGNANGGGNNGNANEERNNCHGNVGENNDYIYGENNDDDDNVEIKSMLAVKSD